LATIKIVTEPLRAGELCEVKITGSAEGQPVIISIGGRVVARIDVKPPKIVSFRLPAGSAGKSLRVSLPGDFDNGFILAP
jgi:hypothetical protein